MVFRAISEELGSPLPYDTIEELRTRITEIAPHVARLDFIENSGFEYLAHADGTGNRLNPTNLVDNVENFYMTDVVSKNSHIMARCTRELSPFKELNFKTDVQTWLTH